MQKLLNLFSWSSLKGKLLTAFMVMAIIPSMSLIFFSYIHTSCIVKEHAEELMQSRLKQTGSTLDVWLDSYEDILFQIYMNDDIVDMVYDINRGEDVSGKSGQLRRMLRGMFYTKEHIKCITVITESGEVIFYDILTGSATQTSWMESIGMDQEEIYDYFSSDNATHILSAKRAGVFAADTYYLFHVGHRIIDYQNVNRPLGVVIVSVDEELLQEVCGGQDRDSQFSFIVDREGKMSSFYKKEFIDTKVIEWSEDLEERKEQYWEFLEKNGLTEFKSGTVEVIYNENFEADIVSVSSQKELLQRLETQQKILLLLIGFTLLILLILIFTITRNLMSSVKRLVGTMKMAEEGKLSIRTVIDRKTPTEIQIVEKQFNHMMDELEQSVKKEKEANERRHKAEIAALEAQINPHFLYNTLDTINWMAIDRDEYEISNSITSLAKILRYGIDYSDGEVTVSRETEWLKQYLFLQQTRMKDMFECEIHVAQDVSDWKIHKLLFQPFVENAIFHGFKTKKGMHILRVSIEPEGNYLKILIWDNGSGMPDELTETLNQGIFPKGKDRECIGMENAVTRLQMYYGDEASVRITSRPGEFTSIVIRIPKVTD